MNKALAMLAKQYYALETSDKNEFQRRARILQSMWRQQHHYEMGVHKTRGNERRLGSRLLMPDAKDSLANFLAENIRKVVRSELATGKADGKLFGYPRIVNDLLSSQPLCFNLFGELSLDLALATNVFGALTNRLVSSVQRVEFEYSPGRRDKRFTNDKTAFDVFVEFQTATEQRGFIGIEVKYHENMRDKPADHRKEYDDIAAAMGCFRPECLPGLRASHLQQVWRDHLLAGRVREACGYAHGFLAVVYPRDNSDCSTAIGSYRACLSDNQTFLVWTLEDVAACVKKLTKAEWIDRFIDRYLCFEKVDRALSKITRIA